MTISRRRSAVHYPETDGKPMAESDLHRIEMVRVIDTLADAFAGRADVYVTGNLLLYYEEGNPRASLAPDAMVVIGVPKTPLRRTYKVWEEGVAPAAVVEVTSPSTRREDLVRKRDLYARLGVQEYYLYDPLAEYLHPALQGYRLEGGTYRPMTPDADGAFLSDALGMRLVLVDGRLRLRDARSGVDLLSPAERAAAADARAAAAEQEVARLRALLEGRGPL